MRPEIQLQGLLFIAVLFGGGGSAYGVANLVVQLAALIILALNPRKTFNFFSSAPRGLVILCCITLALPLAQLIPLPPSVWMQLPGRDLLSESLSLVDRSGYWYPLSLAPARTLIAFFSLIPVVAIFVLAWDLKDSQRESVLRSVVAIAVFVIVIGGLQMLSGNHALIFYPRERIASEFFYGSFANHNSSGLFFVLMIAVLFSADWKRSGGRKLWWEQPWIAGAAAIMLMMTVVLSQSRSSMAVLIIVVFIIGFSKVSGLKFSLWTRFLILCSAMLLSSGVLFVLQGETRFSSGFDRFENLEDVRPVIWKDTVSSAARFWPVGSGISSFPEVFEVDETLEHVWRHHAGRAHNDYLEIAQEGGLLGVGLVVGWLAWLMWATTVALRVGQVRQVVATAAGLVAVALQSIVDYPVRNQTVLCMMALLACLLLQYSYRRGSNNQPVD